MKQIIPINNIFPPERYAEIETGSILLSLPDGRLWVAIGTKNGRLSAFPYSGGEKIEFPLSRGLSIFGLIEDSSLLPEFISLR